MLKNKLLMMVVLEISANIIAPVSMAGGAKAESIVQFANKNNLSGKGYGEVCQAYVNSGQSGEVSERIKRHWLRKSPRQFSKPKYTKSASHLFGSTFKHHVCFTTREHIANGGSGSEVMLKSLKKK